MVAGEDCLHDATHVLHCLLNHLQHVVHVGELYLGKLVGAVLAMAVEGACQVVARVANALQFGNLAQHAHNLHLGLNTQATFAHLVQVVGNFHLHIVGDILVFLYA